MKKLVSIVLLALIWISWIIILGGLGATAADCNDADFIKCSVALSFYWWSTWFAFSINILACMMLFVPMISRLTEYLLIMITTIMMFNANTAYKWIEGEGGLFALQGGTKSAVQAYMAGVVMSIIFYLLLIFISTLDAGTATETKAQPQTPVPAPVTPGTYPPQPMYVAGAGQTV